MEIDKIGALAAENKQPEKEGWGRYLGRKALDYGVSATAGLAAGYAALGLTDISRFDFNDLTFELEQYKASAMVAASLAAGYATHRLLPKILRKTKESAKRVAGYLFEDEVPLKTRKPRVGCIIGLAGLIGSCSLPFFGAKMPYIDHVPYVKKAVDKIDEPNPVRKRNIHFFRYYINPLERIPIPPDDFSKFQDWHRENYGHTGLPMGSDTIRGNVELKIRKNSRTGTWVPRSLVNAKPVYEVYKATGDEDSNHSIFAGYYSGHFFILYDNLMWNHPDVVDIDYPSIEARENSGTVFYHMRKLKGERAVVDTIGPLSADNWTALIKIIGKPGLAFGGPIDNLILSIQYKNRQPERCSVKYEEVDGKTTILYHTYRDNRIMRLRRLQSGEEKEIDLEGRLKKFIDDVNQQK